MRPGIKPNLHRSRTHAELHRLMETTKPRGFLARLIQSMLWGNAPQPRTFSSTSPATSLAGQTPPARGDVLPASRGLFPSS